MNKYSFILLSCLLSITLCSCKEAISDMEQATVTQYSCKTNETKANIYYEKYGKNNSNITVNGYRVSERYGQNTVKAAFKALSHIPEEYLKYVFVTHNIPVKLYTYNVGGLTSFNLNPMRPTQINYSDITSFPHEFGHASMGYVIEKNSSMEKKLTQISNKILTDQNYRKVARPYLTNNGDILTGAKRSQAQQDRETFAEIFDSYYCSRDIRTNLEKTMLDAYNFAKEFLLDPEDE